MVADAALVQRFQDTKRQFQQAAPGDSAGASAASEWTAIATKDPPKKRSPEEVKIELQHIQLIRTAHRCWDTNNLDFALLPSKARDNENVSTKLLAPFETSVNEGGALDTELMELDKSYRDVATLDLMKCKAAAKQMTDLIATTKGIGKKIKPLTE